MSDKCKCMARVHEACLDAKLNFTSACGAWRALTDLEAMLRERAGATYSRGDDSTAVVLRALADEIRRDNHHPKDQRASRAASPEGERT